jgi:hypothetical protein
MTRPLPILLPFVLAMFPAFAAAPPPATEAYVNITSPADGAKLDALEVTKLAYEVRPGPRGDHVHVYVDGKEAGIVRQLKGSYTLEPLAPGPRSLCIKVVNRAHVPIGVEQCIKVTVD